MAEAQSQPEAAAPAAEDAGIYVVARPDERLYQGELLDHVVEWTIGYDENNHEKVISIQPVAHPLAIVLSQDCDVEHDYRQRQQDVWIESDLPSILLCRALPAEQLRQNLGTQKINSARWNTIRSNKDERYAYLADISQASDATGTGHPAILLDLTNYFTVRTPELYRQVRLGEAKPRCRLQTPWREHLQLRFANYLGRIGLSRDHFIPESRRAALPLPLAPPAT